MKIPLQPLLNKGRDPAFITIKILALILSLLLFSSVTRSVEISAGDGEDLVLNTNAALKASLLAPESDSALNLWRLRLGLDIKYRDRTKIGFAYEQRIRTDPDGEGSGFAILPTEAVAPYRLNQLDWSLSEKEEEYSWRHEIDRAYLALNLGRADLTFGRQAVGWGRGVIFSAVDIFSPFQPLEIDREWRRGVDAVRADVKISDRYSLDLVGALGTEMDQSVLAGRLRGFIGRWDGEIIFGRRGLDWLFAATFSAAVMDAEVHGEFAYFDTPEGFPGDGSGVGDRGAVKGVLGASYTWGLGNGLTTWVEYHYSGFGFKDVRQAVLCMASNPDYYSRYLRGDMQIIGRQALAFRAAYEFSDLFNLSLTWIGNPDDSSGVITPVINSILSDHLSITTSAFFPYGAGLDGGITQSEYGSSPVSVFLQVNIYY